MHQQRRPTLPWPLYSATLWLEFVCVEAVSLASQRLERSLESLALVGCRVNLISTGSDTFATHEAGHVPTGGRPFFCF
jgi:hypothetical protein